MKSAEKSYHSQRSRGVAEEPALVVIQNGPRTPEKDKKQGLLGQILLPQLETSVALGSILSLDQILHDTFEADGRISKVATTIKMEAKIPRLKTRKQKTSS